MKSLAVGQAPSLRLHAQQLHKAGLAKGQQCREARRGQEQLAQHRSVVPFGLCVAPSADEAKELVRRFALLKNFVLRQTLAHRDMGS